jgi:hypothetical protein
MKWLLVNNNSRHEIYELWNNEEKLLTIDYYPDKRSLRLHSHDEKRSFLIRKEGFLRSRTVLRNEYGIRMGQLIFDNSYDNQGTVEVSDQQFSYLIHDTSNREAAIYKMSEMLLTCELPAANGNDDLLILTLCWYISSAVTSKRVEYA